MWCGLEKGMKRRGVPGGMDLWICLEVSSLKDCGKVGKKYHGLERVLCGIGDREVDEGI